MSAEQLCLVIPALNEAAFIGATLERIRVALPRSAVVVVDGGSTDDTVGIAMRAGATVVPAPRGRGAQCHAGALHTTSDWLLFLHADTLLPLEADKIIRVFTAKPGAQIATFPVQFDHGGKILNALARAATCGDSVFTRFGDQGILVRRAFYQMVGGFPPWPLFEDVALFQRARKLTRIHWLPGNVVTSARRFQARGIVRQRILNANLMLRYLAGASPHELAARYYGRNPTGTSATSGSSALANAQQRS